MAKRTKAVFFNRVPKTASGLTRFVMAELQEVNGFKCEFDDARPDHPTRYAIGFICASVDINNLY